LARYPALAGPLQVVERVGQVAYRLRLPEGARVHDVFHVGVLKPFRGQPPSSVPSLPPLRHGRPLQQPERALRASLRRSVWHVLIQWAKCQRPRRPGSPLMHSATRFPPSNSRTSCFTRGEIYYGGPQVPEKGKAQQWLRRAAMPGAARDHHGTTWCRPWFLGSSSSSLLDLLDQYFGF
jgi:hypothetical protein